MRDNKSSREIINENLNCYEELLDKLAGVSGGDDIIVWGDMNARISDRKECIVKLSEINRQNEWNLDMFCFEDVRENVIVHS